VVVAVAMLVACVLTVAGRPMLVIIRPFHGTTAFLPVRVWSFYHDDDELRDRVVAPEWVACIPSGQDHRV
jgi:hypothetical protein